MAKTMICDPTGIRAIKDAMETLSGSWKLPILFSLSGGAKRFKEIAREVEGISDKMLSKELKVEDILKVATCFFPKWPLFTEQSVQYISLKSVQSADFKAF